jgi:hypothetical protein
VSAYEKFLLALALMLVGDAKADIAWERGGRFNHGLSIAFRAVSVCWFVVMVFWAVRAAMDAA